MNNWCFHDIEIVILQGSVMCVCNVALQYVYMHFVHTCGSRLHFNEVQLICFFFQSSSSNVLGGQDRGVLTDFSDPILLGGDSTSGLAPPSSGTSGLIPPSSGTTGSQRGLSFTF